MRIVRLGSGDSRRILSARTLFDHAPSPRAVADYLADDRNLVLLALVDDQPAGFLRATVLGQLRTSRPQMFLYEIGVAERFRRQGIGAALVRSLLRYCRSHGFDEAFVLTEPTNAAAVRLYRSTGGRTETRADRMYVYRFRRTRRPPRGRR